MSQAKNLHSSTNTTKPQSFCIELLLWADRVLVQSEAKFASLLNAIAAAAGVAVKRVCGARIAT